MKTSDFDYNLPKELIAQTPLDKRDNSRLLLLSGNNGNVTHKLFTDLPDLLQSGDRLVLNNTKVFPANIVCFKDTGSRIEILFTEKINDRLWKAIARPAKRLKNGVSVFIKSAPKVRFLVDAVMDDGSRLLSLTDESPLDSIEEAMERYGSMPLPPYIKRKACYSDRERYQTVYAERKGAVAAPTAGLHFTESLIHKLRDNGIHFSYITLHVGIGTFRPVKTENPLEHPMHKEKYELTKKTVDEINKTKNSGGRIIAIGTTTVRVLEHCASDRLLKASTDSTRLMILPGYKFKIIDGLITNFHLPCSTLLMLVSAFAGRNNILSAYNEAINKKYRFYSYGDAMFII